MLITFAYNQNMGYTYFVKQTFHEFNDYIFRNSRFSSLRHCVEHKIIYYTVFNMSIYHFFDVLHYLGLTSNRTFIIKMN